jgi:acyl-CoA thioester hydrolase
MRIDRARLDRGIFPHRVEIGTRFSDMDKVGHVNNVAVADLLQEGRNRFIHAIDLMGAARCSLVVAALNVEFAGDLFHPAPVEICVGVLEIGRSSYRIGEIIRQHGRIAVYAEVVQVARTDSGAASLPEAWRPLLERARITPA